MLPLLAPAKGGKNLLEKVLKLYTAAMLGDVRSPTPHLFGPPGSGKSSVVEQAAEMLGVTLHTINVSRISPLELEGVQMPDKTNSKLNLLTAIFWTRMKDGDILLLDEFLRGFPEVYNGLLDILTSRQVAGFQLPKVFIIAASNSTVAYDKALEDRLLHIPVPDPRKVEAVEMHLRKLLIQELGLIPAVINSPEMNQLFGEEILPMYDILDTLTNANRVTTSQTKGRSLRNLIGQVKLREVRCHALSSLIQINNITAMYQKKFQFVVVLRGSDAPEGYQAAAEKLQSNLQRLTPIQRTNLQLNLELIELQKMREDKKNEPEHFKLFE